LTCRVHDVQKLEPLAVQVYQDDLNKAKGGLAERGGRKLDFFIKCWIEQMMIGCSFYLETMEMRREKRSASHMISRDHCCLNEWQF
jgi:hypothetical protein